MTADIQFGFPEIADKTLQAGHGGRPIVLASASPRRKELLQMLGLDSITVCPAEGEEHPISSSNPDAIVKALAHAKAFEVAQRFPDALVIAADTMVWLDNKPFGKPKDEEDAFRMLRTLSDRFHEVFTGVSVIDPGGELCESVRTAVFFRKLSDEEIRKYITCGEPMDKAGAYGAQGKGALFVKEIQGDFFNVMGLPICRLGEMLAKKGVSIL